MCVRVVVWVEIVLMNVGWVWLSEVIVMFVRKLR